MTVKIYCPLLDSISYYHWTLSSPYILWSKTFVAICCKYFLPICDLALQKFLNFMKSNLLIFLYDSFFSVSPKKSLHFTKVNTTTNQVQMRSLGRALIQYDCYPYKKREILTQTPGENAMWQWRQKLRYRSWKPRNAWSCQKLEESRKAISL